MIMTACKIKSSFGRVPITIGLNRFSKRVSWN